MVFTFAVVNMSKYLMEMEHKFSLDMDVTIRIRRRS